MTVPSRPVPETDVQKLRRQSIVRKRVWTSGVLGAIAMMSFFVLSGAEALGVISGKNGVFQICVALTFGLFAASACYLPVSCFNFVRLGYKRGVMDFVGLGASVAFGLVATVCLSLVLNRMLTY